MASSSRRCTATRCSTARSTACRSTIRRRCSTTTSTTSRKPASTPTSRRGTGQELVAAAKKLSKRDGDRVTRWGIMMPVELRLRRLDPAGADDVEWRHAGTTRTTAARSITTRPRCSARMTFWSDLVHKHKVHPAGEQKGPGVSTGVPRRPDLDDAALDRLAHPYPQQRQVPLQGRVRADERAQRGPDRRRLAGACRRASTRPSARPAGP